MANQERPVVAAARKRRIGVQAALADLERAVASGSAQREQDWAKGLASALTRLQDAFGHHIEATESNDGLFADVIEQAPRLAHQVGQLRADHPAIEQSIQQAQLLVADAKGIEPTRISAAGEAVLEL